MSSAQSPKSLSNKPTTITDLPPELITSIYKHLDRPSSITALNSTCRRHYLVWQLNSASISSAVIYDKISRFPLALELLNVQEKVRMVDFTAYPPPTDHLLALQQEARDAVLEDEKGAYRGASLNNEDYSTILTRTRALVSNAKKADHVAKLHIWGVCANGILSPKHGSRLSCGNFTSAFYGVWILTTLGSGKAMDERLDLINGDELGNMMPVVRFLVRDCPDNVKIYLGVSHRVKVKCIGRASGMKAKSKCQFDADWVKAFLRISEKVGDARMVNEMRSTPWGCHGDCSVVSEVTEVNEEELSRGLVEGDVRKRIASKA